MDGLRRWKTRVWVLLAAGLLLLTGATNANAFFITWGSTPLGPLPAVAETVPPDPSGGGDPGTPPPPPPPPDGQGETPTVDPPPPPPNETPEPTSMVTALLGVGLASFVAWRRRGKIAN